MSEQEVRILLTGNKLMEQSGEQLNDLETSLKTCIEGARKNLYTWERASGGN